MTFSSLQIMCYCDDNVIINNGNIHIDIITQSYTIMHHIIFNIKTFYCFFPLICHTRSETLASVMNSMEKMLFSPTQSARQPSWLRKLFKVLSVYNVVEKINKIANFTSSCKGFCTQLITTISFSKVNIS